MGRGCFRSSRNMSHVHSRSRTGKTQATSADLFFCRPIAIPRFFLQRPCTMHRVREWRPGKPLFHIVQGGGRTASNAGACKRLQSAATPTLGCAHIALPLPFTPLRFNQQVIVLFALPPCSHISDCRDARARAIGRTSDAPRHVHSSTICPHIYAMQANRPPESIRAPPRRSMPWRACAGPWQGL